MSDFETEVLERLARIEAALSGLSAGPRPATRGAEGPAPGTTADDADLDSKWGNPAVRYDPKRWVGPSFKGSFFSECPPDYLHELAGFLEWQADKDDQKGEERFAAFKRRDAARARGWAARNARKEAPLFAPPGGWDAALSARAPTREPSPPTDGDLVFDDDIPF